MLSLQLLLVFIPPPGERKWKAGTEGLAGAVKLKVTDLATWQMWRSVEATAGLKNGSVENKPPGAKQPQEAR